MNDLIERLTQQAGISPEQAQKAVEAIASFVKEKFPMLGGAVDQIFTPDGKAGDDKPGTGNPFGGFGNFG